MSPDDPFKRTFPDENYVPPKEEDLRKQALQKAYEIAASITAEQAQGKRPTVPIDRGALLRLVNAVLAVVMAFWLLLAPPDWLPQSARDRRSPEQHELGVRLLLAAEAARVNAYLDAEGKLPESLADVGGDARTVRYVVTGDGRFTLSASDGGAAVTYESTQPLGTLLGGSGGKP